MSTDTPQYRGIDHAADFVEAERKRVQGNNAYLLTLLLRWLGGWYDLPWRVRQRLLTGTTGTLRDISSDQPRKYRRANHSPAQKANRMSKWRSRICYKGVYMPRDEAVRALPKVLR